MNTEERRKELLNLLKLDIKPVSANNLAERFNVSRQIIVGDIALLRAAGADIIATSKGYVLNKNSEESKEANDADSYVIATKHDKSALGTELFTIVDNGGAVLNVSVEHPIYGTITQNLDIKSRYDADKFLNKVAVTGAALVCELTGGIHMHTVRCPEPEAYRRILMQLKQQGILYIKS